MKRLLVPFFALLVAVLACAPLGGTTPADDEPAAPADTPNADQSGAAEDTGDDGASAADAPDTFLFAGLGLDDHNSFSFDFDGTLTPVDSTDSADVATFSGTMMAQRDPRVASWQMTFDFPEGVGGEGFQAGSGSIVGFLVEGILYSVIESDGTQACVGVPETGDVLGETMGIFTGPDSFSDPKYHTGDLKLVESGVEVNGFVTDYYHGENVSNEDFENGVIDIWVIQGESTPVEMTVTGQTDDDTVGLVNVVWNYTLLSLDQPVEVTVPENCTVFGADS